ncbi:Outer membrane lipoprotein-sorting protein [Poseidonocella sedimentorum]|uniref:Outer membrane lipoprotein-sorting protein n=2 Tax=Poseidonocella sedimentorum TaxID=871652 RepID=A0A1I6E9C2_9RHOB|nr:Outer membrane lipoprotein-sorting protein [Poseidonocella sedimentorum]
MALVAALSLGSGAASAEKLPLSDLSAHLNALQSGVGEFTQINPDGTIATGTVYIKRPGRIRFEYDPPDAALVMAGGGQVAVFDPVSNEPPVRFPLRETPLSVVLGRDVDLARANMVVGHSSDSTTTSVTAQDPDHPEYGNIRLVFSGPPVELRQWVVTDDSGAQTTVILGELDRSARVNDVLFNIMGEMRKRGFR